MFVEKWILHICIHFRWKYSIVFTECFCLGVRLKIRHAYTSQRSSCVTHSRSWRSLNIAKLLRGKYLRGEIHARENRGGKGREKDDTLLDVRHDFPHVTSANIKYSVAGLLACLLCESVHSTFIDCIWNINFWSLHRLSQRSPQRVVKLLIPWEKKKWILSFIIFWKEWKLQI